MAQRHRTRQHRRALAPDLSGRLPVPRSAVQSRGMGDPDRYTGRTEDVGRRSARLMATVAIVDDEPLARRGVRARLAAFPEVKIVAECADGHAAVKAIRELAPEIVFLDVQMPGMSGFDVLKELSSTRLPTIIFLTAYDSYALRAFEVHALDYLLKPIDDERFAAA